MNSTTLTFNVKELILLYITIVGFISYIPQIVRLIRQKSSEDVSVITWFIRSINSALYLLYLYLSNVTKWLMLSQLLEVLLITVTLLTVLFFRIRTRLLTKTVKETDTNN